MSLFLFAFDFTRHVVGFDILAACLAAGLVSAAVAKALGFAGQVEGPLQLAVAALLLGSPGPLAVLPFVLVWKYKWDSLSGLAANSVVLFAIGVTALSLGVVLFVFDFQIGLSDGSSVLVAVTVAVATTLIACLVLERFEMELLSMIASLVTFSFNALLSLSLLVLLITTCSRCLP